MSFITVLEDLSVLMSVAVIILHLINTIRLKKAIFGFTAIELLFLLTAIGFLTFLLGSKNLINSIIFGVISGFLIQPFADKYLLKKTLAYSDKRYLFPGTETPIWVAGLWGIALTQLSYFWLRLTPLIGYMGIPQKPYLRWLLAKWIIFTIIGFLYFFVFELIASNWTDWWQRRHCKKKWGVPIYVMTAEFFTVALLPVYYSQADTFVKLIFCGITYGIFVAITFFACCMVAYNPKAD